MQIVLRCAQFYSGSSCPTDSAKTLWCRIESVKSLSIKVSTNLIQWHNAKTFRLYVELSKMISQRSI